MKSKENQIFSTFDTLTVLGAVIAVGIVIFPILNRQIEVQHIESARLETERISQELILKNLARVLPKEGVRMIASDVGAPTLGSDPWGQPFQYKVLRNAYGQPTHIAVWSMGPNKKDDTREITVRPNASFVRLFMGDDIGSLKPVH